MRVRIIAVVLAAVCLCACSDGGGAKPCEVDEKFRADVTITQGGKEFCAVRTSRRIRELVANSGK